MSCHVLCDETGFSLDEIWEASAAGRLLTMEVEFSRLCNFRCPYCYLDVRPQEELTSAEWRGIILQGRDLGARQIIILGGEPMIYPRILENIRFIRDHGMAVEIFTNGSNISAENARELAALDVKVVLKMNSLDPEKQDQLCGVHNANQIIQDAFRHLKLAGYGEGGKPLAVSSVISADNFDELPTLWRWLRKQQVTPYFEVITPQGEAVDNAWLQVDPLQAKGLFEEIARIDCEEFGREWDMPIQPPLVGDACLRHQFSCYVNALGDVMPCVGVTLPLGNVRAKKLADILHDSEVLEDLRNHRHTIKGPCATCDNSETCYGCRGSAYQLTGDYLASDPLCWNNHGREKEIDHLPMPIGDLIPHRAPMRLVDSLLSVGERTADIETRIAADNIFLNDNGALDSIAYLEIIAQAAAAHNGFRSRHLDATPEGMLLGAKALTVSGQAFSGDCLVTRVYKEARLGGFGIIKGTIFRGDTCIATGEIKVFHQETELTT